MNGNPANSRQFQRFYSIEFDFPFYIIKKRGFEFVDEVGLMKRINGQQVTDDEVYFTIYKIESDYRPDEAGVDFMGSLMHVHVTQDFLDGYGVHGVDCLKAQDLL
ncbi:hypothetical protein VQ056_23160 [Paenibacillus sp. JTLBN-2024]